MPENHLASTKWLPQAAGPQPNRENARIWSRSQWSLKTCAHGARVSQTETLIRFTLRRRSPRPTATRLEVRRETAQPCLATILLRSNRSGRRYWEENQTFRTPDLPEGEKIYVLDMFPYPSGDGLHVGHPGRLHGHRYRLSRFERMRGKSVLHPMGFDAFGLPAEEHAIRTNTPPRESTERNIATFRRQLKMLGFSYDWERELATTDVDYFRWTQWIFLVLFDTWFDAAAAARAADRRVADSRGRRQPQGEDAVRRYQDEHRLAYQADALVNWCPALGTVLANEEVVDGKSERGGPSGRAACRCGNGCCGSPPTPIAWRRTWSDLDWSDGIKKLQRDWIGRSTGAEVDFFIGDADAIRSLERRSASRAVSPASRATMCCGSTRRAPTRCSAPPTW